MIGAWRRPLTQTSLLLMESMWAYALVAFFIAITVEGDRPTVFGVGAVVIVSFGISRLLMGVKGMLPLRIWGSLLSLIIFYVIVRIDFFGDWRLWDFSFANDLFNHTEATLEDKANAVIAIPVLWLFWLRGISRGQQSLIFEEIVNSFALGLLIVGFVLLVGPGVGTPGAVGNVGVPYIGIGLLTIAFAHASRSEKDFGKSFGASWLAAVGAAVALIAVVAGIFLILDLEILQQALGDTSLAVTKAVFHFFGFLAWPFEQFINGLFKGLKWFFDNVFGGQKPERQQEQAIATPAPNDANDNNGDTPAWLQLILRLIIGGGVAAVALFVLWITFMRFSRRQGPEEVTESTYQEGRLASDLGNMFGSLFGRLRPNIHLRNANADPVRRLYFEMLESAADKGIERRPPETPNELLPRLATSYRLDVPSRITSSFDDVRYGNLPISETEAKRLKDEWDREKR